MIKYAAYQNSMQLIELSQYESRLCIRWVYSKKVDHRLQHLHSG